MFRKKESKASNEYQLEFSKTLDVTTKRHCPFQVVEKINDTAYKLQFHGKYQVNVTFIFVDFTLFNVNDELNSRTNLFEKGGNDMIQQRPNDFKYFLQWMKEPMTKARPQRTRKPFQSIVMQVPKPRIVSLVQLEDNFSKLKDNNLKNTISPRVYTL